MSRNCEQRLSTVLQNQVTQELKRCSVSRDLPRVLHAHWRHDAKSHRSSAASALNGHLLETARPGINSQDNGAVFLQPLQHWRSKHGYAGVALSTHIVGADVLMRHLAAVQEGQP